jgi:hypothetical protein
MKKQKKKKNNLPLRKNPSQPPLIRGGAANFLLPPDKGD